MSDAEESQWTDDISRAFEEVTGEYPDFVSDCRFQKIDGKRFLA
tara:strand:+ start:134 stop:265 length:132 start_codon:yes stop_codon:yes gene_type:complete